MSHKSENEQHICGKKILTEMHFSCKVGLVYLQVTYFNSELINLICYLPLKLGLFSGFLYQHALIRSHSSEGKSLGR